MIFFIEILRLKINFYLLKLCNYIFIWIGYSWNIIYLFLKEIEVENDRLVIFIIKGIEKGWLC